MSKATVKINNIRRKLDSISGLDGDYVQERLEKIENLVNKTAKEIEKHCNENEINGTIFENTSADKLFEKLDYKIDIGEIYGVVRYKHIKEDYYIRFYIEDKTFDCNKIIDNEIYPLEIDKKLLKAICKKAEELKW